MNDATRYWLLGGDVLVEIREDGTFALPKKSRSTCRGFVYGCECGCADLRRRAKERVPGSLPWEDSRAA